MVKSNYLSRSHKDIADDKPINYVRCNCTGSRPGIISCDPLDHTLSCRFRKRAVKSVTTVHVFPTNWHDGYELGVVVQ